MEQNKSIPKQMQSIYSQCRYLAKIQGKRFNGKEKSSRRMVAIIAGCQFGEKLTSTTVFTTYIK